MIEVRMLTNDEMKQAIRLSDATFRDEEQPSMAEAFPFIFSDSAMHCSFGAFENAKLVSFMGLVPWTVRIGEARLRVFSLGSVCTHPDVRGRGMASEVLSAVYEYIGQAGASLLLVSGNRSLYTRNGCAAFGRIRKYGWDEQAANLVLGRVVDPNRQVREMKVADIFELYDVASARGVRYDLGVNELATLLKSEALASCMKMKHRILVSEESGVIRAFGVFGEPADPRSRGVVLEYGGEPGTVMRLAAHAVRSFNMNGLDFPVPWHETELHHQMTFAGLPSSEEDHLGTIRIIDAKALVEQLQPWLESKDARASAELRIEHQEDGVWHLQAGDDQIRLSGDELIRLVFDCSSAEAAGHELPAFLKQLFPIPFPYTGGLNYI
jgi:predicted N-acetyltransferase YhbS